jgi:hypothetical protein
MDPNLMGEFDALFNKFLEKEVNGVRSLSAEYEDGQVFLTKFEFISVRQLTFLCGSLGSKAPLLVALLTPHLKACSNAENCLERIISQKRG